MHAPIIALYAFNTPCIQHGSVVKVGINPPLFVCGPPPSVGFPLKLCLHFLLLNSFLLLTAQSNDWSVLISSALF